MTSKNVFEFSLQIVYDTFFKKKMYLGTYLIFFSHSRMYVYFFSNDHDKT